jgi:hypothetical protein
VLRKEGREAAIDVKAVPGMGAEIVLSDGQWRKTRLFRSHEQAELVGPIADTRTMFEGKGGGMKFNLPIVRRAEGVMVAGVIVLVLVAYRISKALTRRSGGIE